MPPLSDTLPPADTGPAGPVGAADLFEQAAVLLDAHPGYRVIRALPAPSTLVLPAPEGKVRRALIIDTETTGLDWRSGRIIEIAACPVDFDARGGIVAVGETRSWCEDPGTPLQPEISRLTGLTDADLAGRSIDDAAVTRMLGEADLVIAHNAGFDRPWWQARYPLARTRPWACSLREVDWRGHGCEARTLAALLAEVGGWFNTRHRALADVDALVALLTVRLPPGHSVATELIFTASRPTVRLAATNAPFAAREALRQRGYRWDAVAKVWQIELPADRQDDEVAWLAANAGCRQPAVTPVTWHDRHG